MTSLDVDYGTKTIQEFVILHNHGQLNLEPGFQRKSVWGLRDREKLIESIATGRPMPSVQIVR